MIKKRVYGTVHFNRAREDYKRDSVISSSMYLARTGQDRTPDTKQDRKQTTSDSGSEG